MYEFERQENDSYATNIIKFAVSPDSPNLLLIHNY